MPQAEVVLNKPLTGEEVRQIIVNKLIDRLRGDTRLADYVAVPAFEFRLDLVLLLEGAVHNKIDHTVDPKQTVALHDRFPHQPEFTVFQVADAAMDHV